MASCSFFTAFLTSAKASYGVLLLARTLCYLLDHKVHEGKAQISPDLSWHTADHSHGVSEPMDLSVLAPTGMIYFHVCCPRPTLLWPRSLFQLWAHRLQDNVCAMLGTMAGFLHPSRVEPNQILQSSGSYH